MIKNSVRGKETVERNFEREAFSAVFFVSMHTKGTDEWQVLQVCL